MKPRKQLLSDLKDHIKVCELTGNADCLSAKLAHRSRDEIERLSSILFANNICPNEGHLIGPAFKRDEQTDEIIQL